MHGSAQPTGRHKVLTDNNLLFWAQVLQSTFATSHTVTGGSGKGDCPPVLQGTVSFSGRHDEGKNGSKRLWIAGHLRSNAIGRRCHGSTSTICTIGRAVSTWTGVGVCAMPTLPAKSFASTRTYIVAGLPDRSGHWYWPELSRLEPMGRQGPFAFSA